MRVNSIIRQDVDYKSRPSVDELLGALDGMTD